MVYDYLDETICNASMFLTDKGNTTHFHIVGWCICYKYLLFNLFEL